MRASLLLLVPSLAVAQEPAVSTTMPAGYTTVALGYGTGLDRKGPVLMAGHHRFVTSRLALGIEGQVHAWSEQRYDVVAAPCPIGGPCTAPAAPEPSTDLVLLVAGAQVYEEARRNGFFLVAGGGPGYFLRRPAGGPWALALTCGLGLALPMGDVRLRFEGRGYRVMGSQRRSGAAGAFVAGFQF